MLYVCKVCMFFCGLIFSPPIKDNFLQIVPNQAFFFEKTWFTAITWSTVHTKIKTKTEKNQACKCEGHNYNAHKDRRLPTEGVREDKEDYWDASHLNMYENKTINFLLRKERSAFYRFLSVRSSVVSASEPGSYSGHYCLENNLLKN